VTRGRTHRARSRARSTATGMTLIEVLVVMTLVALVVGSASVGFRSLAKSDMRTSASKLSGTIRYLFDRASTTGKIHRLVLDMDKGKYWAEVSDDRFIMASGRETEESRRREAVKLAKEAEAAKKRAEEKTGLDQMQARYQPEEFRPKRARFGAFKEMAIKTVELKGVVIRDVFTPRLAEPLQAGQGYIYFFPLGMTEAAIVHLSDKKQETNYSLVVHPLTGRVQIKNSYIQPPLEKQYDDQDKEIAP
jgi:prepilin-type N-terminal cleavage/methylation domain-containing protein